MNSATRVSKILSKIRATKDTNALEIFKNVFEVDSCTDVANKLLICNKDVNRLKDGVHQSIINKLDALFQCHCLNRDIGKEKNELISIIQTLDSVAYYMPDDEINEDDLVKLSQSILALDELLKDIELPKEHKEIIYIYIDSIQGALKDIHIGGIEPFEKHIVVANGTVVLYNEAFKNEDVNKIIKKIYKQSTAIINDSQLWYGCLGYGVGLLQ